MMTVTIDQVRGTATLPVWPETGQLLGLGRSQTYAAVERGEIPTLRFGRRIVVPTAKLLKMLGADDD